MRWERKRAAGSSRTLRTAFRTLCSKLGASYMARLDQTTKISSAGGNRGIFFKFYILSDNYHTGILHGQSFQCFFNIKPPELAP